MKNTQKKHLSTTSVRDCSGVKFLELEKMKQNRKVSKNLTGAESPTPRHFFILFLLYIQEKDRKNGEGERPVRGKKINCEDNCKLTYFCN